MLRMIFRGRKTGMACHAGDHTGAYLKWGMHRSEKTEMKPSGSFDDLHRHREDIRPLVAHEVYIGHHMYEVFQVPLDKVREPLVPAPEDQDMDPLNNEAYAGDDPVHPQDDPNDDPVHDTDEQFETACVMLEHEELLTVGHGKPKWCWGRAGHK